MSVDVAVGCADSEAKEVAEGDAEVDREADAERVPARTDAVPPPAVTEAHPEVVESVEAVREGVVVVESLAGRVREARREGEATEVPLEKSVPAAEGEGGALAVVEAQPEPEGLRVTETPPEGLPKMVRVSAPVALVETHATAEALGEEVPQRVGGGDAEAHAVRDSAAVALCVFETRTDAHVVGVRIDVRVGGLEGEGEAQAVAGVLPTPEPEALPESEEAAGGAVGAPVAQEELVEEPVADHGAVSVTVPEAEDEGVEVPLAVHVSDAVALLLVVDDPPALWVAELLGL